MDHQHFLWLWFISPKLDFFSHAQIVSQFTENIVNVRVPKVGYTEFLFFCSRDKTFFFLSYLEKKEKCNKSVIFDESKKSITLFYIFQRCIEPQKNTSISLTVCLTHKHKKGEREKKEKKNVRSGQYE